MKKKSKAKIFFRDHIRPILSKLTGTQEIHWCCVVMDEETRKMVLKLNPQQLDTLEISGCDWEPMGFKSYEIAHYPDFDICTSVLEKKYDLVVAEQVFEHLLTPYQAATNVYSMLRKDGYFLITTPFLIKYHGCPDDCTRWTETGIKYFLAEAGFPIDHIQTGSWGNRSCVKGNFRKWTRYRPWLHSLRNEPEFPVSVWALAQKK
jgi:hypothetical protein